MKNYLYILVGENMDLNIVLGMFCLLSPKPVGLALKFIAILPLLWLSVECRVLFI